MTIMKSTDWNWHWNKHGLLHFMSNKLICHCSWVSLFPGIKKTFNQTWFLSLIYIQWTQLFIVYTLCMTLSMCTHANSHWNKHGIRISFIFNGHTLCTTVMRNWICREIVSNFTGLKLAGNWVNLVSCMARVLDWLSTHKLLSPFKGYPRKFLPSQGIQKEKPQMGMKIVAISWVNKIYFTNIHLNLNREI